jgi:hypothetical protein
MRMPTLLQFFRHQLSPSFAARGLGEPATIEYVSEVLARFAYTRELYAVRDTQDRPLEYVVDYLMAERGDGAARGDRARRWSILRHLGEYTLFMSGLFRDRLHARGELNYYLTQGAQAYQRCADIEPQSARRQLFRRLHRDFTPVADTLDDIRRTRLNLPADGVAVRGGDRLLAAMWQR